MAHICTASNGKVFYDAPVLYLLTQFMEITVDHSQLRAMARETLDSIDWPLPPQIIIVLSAGDERVT